MKVESVLLFLAALQSSVDVSANDRVRAVQCASLCVALIPDQQRAQPVGEARGELFAIEEKRGAWTSLWKDCRDRVGAAGFPEFTAMLVKAIHHVDSSHYRRDEIHTSGSSQSETAAQFASRAESFRKGKFSRMKVKNYSGMSSSGSSQHSSSSSYSRDQETEENRQLAIDLEAATSGDPAVCEPVNVYPEELIPEYTGRLPVQG